MSETQVKKFPEYVTDGSHIYLWVDEYEALLQDGRLKPSGPPAPAEQRELLPREKTKLEQLRKKALQDAENAVKLLRAAGGDTSTVFGDAPKETE